MEKFFKRLFSFSSRAIVALAVMAVIGFFVLAATESSLFGMMTVVGICAMPLAVLAFVVSGIGLIARRFNDRQKAKRSYANRAGMQAAEDSKQMRRIMAQLSPEDRDYLRERLAAQKMGLSDDGEIVALDDLMTQYDQESSKEKRS